MAEPIQPSVYDAARAYDLTLGPVRIQKPEANPDLKCADAVVDAYQLEGDTAKLLGQIKTMYCNNPTAISTTMDNFAVKHNLVKRTDLQSCPKMTVSIADQAKSMLTGHGWLVSEHMIKSPKGIIISFIGTEANQSISITPHSPSEILLNIEECSGSSQTVVVNVASENIRILP